MNKRVTAIGGIFVKCDNPDAQRAWYNKHLGFQTDQYGTSFEWRKADAPEEKGYNVWSTFKRDTTYFAPSEKEFMLNFRVENLEWLLEELRKEGVQIVGEMEIHEYGKFAHIIDPEGTKIELWESIDEEYAKLLDGNVTK
jgi:predicted enzyme related to lactoylglutathione lyase